MTEFIRPRVFISKCLTFEHCRWNGNIIESPVVEILKSFIDFQPVCAEVEIGLGVPRDPVRLVKQGEKLMMIQSKTDKDITEKMVTFCNKFLNEIVKVDGFILKTKSPSCGIKETKHYADMQAGSPVLERGAGLFGHAVINKFNFLPIETEGRLRNFKIREHYLTKLYTVAQFNVIKERQSLHELIQFHARNKFLYMAYNQEKMRILGNILGNQKDYSFQDLIEKYEKILLEIMVVPPKYTSNINVLMHALGYFKKELSYDEKNFFLDIVNRYRDSWIPLFLNTNLLKSWIVRFHQTYLEQQTFFEPFPKDLMTFDLKNTWRGLDYWKNNRS